jgi:hypothetical protein
VIRRLVAEHGQRAGWPSLHIVSEDVLAKDTDTSAGGAAVRAINRWSCAFRRVLFRTAPVLRERYSAWILRSRTW